MAGQQADPYGQELAFSAMKHGLQGLRVSADNVALAAGHRGPGGAGSAADCIKQGHASALAGPGQQQARIQALIEQRQMQALPHMALHIES